MDPTASIVLEIWHVVLALLGFAATMVMALWANNRRMQEDLLERFRLTHQRIDDVKDFYIDKDHWRDTIEQIMASQQGMAEDIREVRAHLLADKTRPGGGPGND